MAGEPFVMVALHLPAQKAGSWVIVQLVCGSKGSCGPVAQS
jgi:hypothetical protein